MSFGDFISASAYQVMFIDRSLLLGAKQLWRCSHLANAASLNDWSFMVLVGLPTKSYGMVCVIQPTSFGSATAGGLCQLLASCYEAGAQTTKEGVHLLSLVGHLIALAREE
jgi:uncharacterized membrane protein